MVVADVWVDVDRLVLVVVVVCAVLVVVAVVLVVADVVTVVWLVSVIEEVVVSVAGLGETRTSEEQLQEIDNRTPMERSTAITLHFE